MCGYDDFRFATLCQPPLTTYRVNAEQMASAVVAWLARKIRQEEPPESMMWTVPGCLVVRESTGAAPGKQE